MAQEQPQDGDDGEQPGNEPVADKMFLIEDIPLVEGERFVIPSRFRDMYDIEVGDVVDIRVATPDDLFLALDLRVGTEYRVTVPQRKRQLYDMEGLDTITVEVQPTEMTMEEA